MWAAQEDMLSQSMVGVWVQTSGVAISLMVNEHRQGKSYGFPVFGDSRSLVTFNILGKPWKTIFGADAEPFPEIPKALNIPSLHWNIAADGKPCEFFDASLRFAVQMFAT